MSVPYPLKEIEEGESFWTVDLFVDDVLIVWRHSFWPALFSELRWFLAFQIKKAEEMLNEGLDVKILVREHKAKRALRMIHLNADFDSSTLCEVFEVEHVVSHGLWDNRNAVDSLVDRSLRGELDIDGFIDEGSLVNKTRGCETVIFKPYELLDLVKVWELPDFFKEMSTEIVEVIKGDEISDALRNDLECDVTSEEFRRTFCFLLDIKVLLCKD